MGLKDISNVVTSRLGRQILTVQKHSPRALFVVGVVGVVGTVVLASRATLKVEEVLHEHEVRMDKIDKATELQAPNLYTAEDASKDRVLAYVKTTGSLIRLYAPAVIVGAASIAALTGSHIVLTNRLGNVTAAYAALDKGFRAYRQRVVDELGPQKDAEFRHGVETKDVVEEGPNGPEITTIKTATGTPSIYARFFDEGSPSWSRQYGQNQFFIKCQQQWANDRLHARGHLFLNEVYDMLGLPRTKQGAVVGWVTKKNGGAGDDFVDFGIFNNNEFTITRFLNGDERSILLDFNVDGVILDLI
jgi:hypothetical protein